MADQDPWEAAAKAYRPTGAGGRGGATPTPKADEDWKVWQQGADQPAQSTLDRAKQNLIPSAINSVKNTVTGPHMGNGGQVPGNYSEAPVGPPDIFGSPTYTPEQHARGIGPQLELGSSLPQRFQGRLGNLLHSAPLIEHPYETIKNAFAEDPIGTIQAPLAMAMGATDKIPDAGAGVSRLTRADPTVAVTRALRPTPSNPDFPIDLPRAISLVKAANPRGLRGFKPSVENGQLNIAPAVDRAIAMHQEALQPWLERAEGQRFSGQPVIEATRAAAGRLLPSEAPSGERLIEQAHQDYGDFTPQELRDRLTLLNQRLSSFYNRAPGAQSAALSDIPEAVLKAQRDAVADTLYRGLDPENEGAGPRLIQSRTGDLIDLRDAALRRNNAIVSEQPVTPLERLLNPVKGMIQHVLPSKVSGLSFSEGSGRSLPLLRKAFNAVPETEGANELGSLPRPGPRSLMAATDTSGPIPAAARDFSSVGSDFGVPRIKLLPAASSPVGVSGTIVPDLAGDIRRGANAMNTGPLQLPPAQFEGRLTQPPVRRGGTTRLLPAPEPGQPPVNVLPTGPGAIGPAANPNAYGPDVPREAGGELGGRLLDVLRLRREQAMKPPE